jgi:hypothetical protein
VEGQQLQLIPKWKSLKSVAKSHDAPILKIIIQCDIKRIVTLPIKTIMSEIVEQISLEIIFYGTGHKQLSMFCI